MNHNACVIRLKIVQARKRLQHHIKNKMIDHHKLHGHILCRQKIRDLLSDA